MISQFIRVRDISKNNSCNRNLFTKCTILQIMVNSARRLFFLLMKKYAMVGYSLPLCHRLLYGALNMLMIHIQQSVETTVYSTFDLALALPL